jgi:hypothetical protein
MFDDTTMLGALIAASFAILIGLMIVFGAWRSYRLGQAAFGWRQTSGAVIESSLIEREGNVSDAQRYDTNRELIQQAYAANLIARIVYRFTVNGKEYTGQAVGAVAATEKHLQEKYPVGKSVSVFYNPASPQECVADPSSARNRINLAISLIAALIMFAIAAVPLIYVFAPEQIDRLIDLARGVMP